MPASINGSTGGGAAAPSGDGVVTVVGGAFVSPAASAASTRSTLGLGGLATASSVASTDISDSSAAGRSVLTAADASAQRTALGLGGAATLSVGTTAGTVAAGNLGLPAIGAESTVLTVSGGVAAWTAPSAVRVPEPMLAYPPAVAFSRTATTALVDLAMDTGWTLVIVGRRTTGQGVAGTLEGLVGYGTIGTGFYIGATNSGANNTGDPVVMLGYGSNINAAGVSTQAQLGQSLPAPGAPGANYCVAIEVRASTIAISVNGAAATTVARTGTYVPPITTSDLYLGARFNDSAATHHGLAEIVGIQQAVGDAALASLSAAGLSAMTVQGAMSATNRSNTKFLWCAADGGTQLRVGQAPITQTGIVPWGLAT